jgi:hypothetical protein
LLKVPDLHEVFTPSAIEVTEGVGGPSIGNVRGVAWEPWIDWLPVRGALVWTDSKVFRNPNNTYVASEVTITPGGESLGDVRGITWENWYEGYIGEPAALIWTGTQLYSYYSAGGGAQVVTVDPGGAPVSDVQGITWEYRGQAGARPVALIWTPTKVFYYNTNVSLTTVTEVTTLPGPPFFSISDVQGIVWEHSGEVGGGSTALIWTPTRVFYYNANLTLMHALQVTQATEPPSQPISGVRGIAWQEIEYPGGRPYALIWTGDQVFQYNVNLDLGTATEVTKIGGSIAGVQGIAWQHWQGYEPLTEALIWSPDELLHLTGGATTASEVLEDGLDPIDGVLGVAWETVSYAAGAPSALVWTSGKVLSYSLLTGTATEVQIGGSINDVRGITWEYWSGENTPVALIWTPGRLFQHTVTGVGDDEVKVFPTAESISGVQAAVWEPFETRWDPDMPIHTALIWTPTKLFWYCYTSPQALEVKEDGNSIYSYDSTSVAMVQVTVQQAGHHNFESPLDSLRTSQSGAGMVGTPAYTPVGYTGSASGARVVPASGPPASHITVLGGSPYPNTAMILGPTPVAGLVSGDAMCLFGYSSLSGMSEDRESPGGRSASLDQNYPNPFNPATTIAYTLPVAGRVDLRIFDVSGRLIRVLRDNTPETSGRHEVLWDGRDTSGREVSSGVYFYRLTAGASTETKRTILLR